MSRFASRIDRVRQNAEKIDRMFTNEIVQEHDDPSIKSEFNTKICPHCNVPFVENKNRGAKIDNGVGIHGKEDEFFMVCPLCGMCPY